MMNRILTRVLFTVSGLSALIPANSRGFVYQSVLTQEDWIMEDNDRKRGPALSSGRGDPNPWESYNQWICFQSEELELLNAEIEYNDQIKTVPLLEAKRDNHLFQISIDGDVKGDFPRMFEEWNQIVATSPEVCVYAAFLQQDRPAGMLTSSQWIVSRIKGNARQWVLDEDSDSEL